jgi:catechol 2,3-dioxygenase-like lactoylglutathione lyase family enzyme
MDDIYSMGYVAVGVPDLERATSFLGQVCRLAIVQRDDTTAFVTGDERHHWLRLEATDQPALVRLGYEATGPEAVDRLRGRLDKAGVAVAESAGPSEGVHGAIRFLDPNGIEFEVYEAMTRTSRRPAAAYAGHELFLHTVVHVPDPLGTLWFYEDVLGLRRSDRIADLVVFLRAGNRYHHSLALARGAVTKLDHVAIHVHEIDDVMRMRAHAMATGTLSDDVVKHTASGSISVYLRDEDNDLGVEFCTQHGIIDREDYRGRVLVPSPSTVNMWSDPFPDSNWQLDLDRIKGARGATAAARTGSGT